MRPHIFYLTAGLIALAFLILKLFWDAEQHGASRWNFAVAVIVFVLYFIGLVLIPASRII